MEDIVTIKWDSGYMELNIREFIDVVSDKNRYLKIADLCRNSDKYYDTQVIPQIQQYCSDLLDMHKNYGDSWNYSRETKSWVHRIEEFLLRLSEPLPVQYKSKRLF